MTTKIETKSIETGANKIIEGLQYLRDLKSMMVEIDYINLGVSDTKFITELLIVETSKFITLDEENDDIVPIRLLKEQIFDIEQIFENQIIIHTLNCDIKIDRL